jgi:hypothetical protein
VNVPEEHGNISIELQGFKINLIVNSLSHLKLLRLLTTFGFGVTYFPLRINWMQNEESRAAHQNEIQKEFDNLALHIPRVRRLDVATLVPLNMLALTPLHELRMLNITGAVLGDADLSQLLKLRRFSGRHPSIQKIQGLSNLCHLGYVEVPFPTKKFVENLPPHLLHLFLQCQLPKEINTSNLTDLKTLSLDSIKQLDFKTFREPILHLQKLELSGISTVKNLEHFLMLCPNLKSITTKLQPRLNSEIRRALPLHIKMRVPLLWRMATKSRWMDKV